MEGWGVSISIDPRCVITFEPEKSAFSGDLNTHLSKEDTQMTHEWRERLRTVVTRKRQIKAHTYHGGCSQKHRKQVLVRQGDPGAPVHALLVGM